MCGNEGGKSRIGREREKSCDLLTGLVKSASCYAKGSGGRSGCFEPVQFGGKIWDITTFIKLH